MEIGAFNYNAPNTPKSFTTKMIKNRINPAAAYVNSGNPIISSYNQSGYNIPGLSVDFKTIIYFNNLWCAFNNQTSTSYYTSPDGVTWTIRTAPMAVVNNIHRIGSSIYLIPANANPYYTTDGINWNNVGSANGSNLKIYSLGSILLRPDDSSNYSTSTDGANWTSRAYPITAIGGLCSYIVNGTAFISAGGYLSYSSDGINWTTVSTTLKVNDYSIDGSGFIIGYYNGKYYFVKAKNLITGGSTIKLNIYSTTDFINLTLENWFITPSDATGSAWVFNVSLWNYGTILISIARTSGTNYFNYNTYKTRIGDCPNVFCNIGSNDLFGTSFTSMICPSISLSRGILFNSIESYYYVSSGLYLDFMFDTKTLETIIEL